LSSTEKTSRKRPSRSQCPCLLWKLFALRSEDSGTIERNGGSEEVRTPDLRFSKGQFVSFSKTFPRVLEGEKDFQIWSDILVKEYGAPTTTKTQTFQNA